MTKSRAAANLCPIPDPAGDVIRSRQVHGIRESLLRREILRIVREDLLQPVFQPILGFRTRSYFGYEGLIRGPSGSPLEMPLPLFAAATEAGLSTLVETASRKAVLRGFSDRGLQGKLFINVSPGTLLEPDLLGPEALSMIRALGIAPSQIVLEVTENQKITDFTLVKKRLALLRGLGIEIAIDDLGEGFSNLRLWTELHPEFVKVDRHYISGIETEPLKYELVKSIHSMAEASHAHLIAEGVETSQQFSMLRRIGIAFGQGYFIERPGTSPRRSPAGHVEQELGDTRIAVAPNMPLPPAMSARARALVRRIVPVSPEDSNEDVYARLEANPEERAIPVVRDGCPVGLISRWTLIDRFARPFRRELFGRRACTLFMDHSPIIADHAMSIQELSRLITRSEAIGPSDGFIITEAGRYLGYGSNHDLMALITELQIKAASYANPLTQLPGNVPLEEHIGRLLAAGASFAAAYCDLNHFKPFNDVCGYRAGDELIRLLASLLCQESDPRLDFVAHIGGDDFMILFQSADWRVRCERIVTRLGAEARSLCAEESLERGGFESEDRLGRIVFHPLPTLAIGVVPVEPGFRWSHHDISAAAAEAKKQAKRGRGGSVFVERRRLGAPKVSREAIAAQA